MRQKYDKAFIGKNCTKIAAEEFIQEFTPRSCPMDHWSENLIKELLKNSQKNVQKNLHTILHHEPFQEAVQWFTRATAQESI